MKKVIIISFITVILLVVVLTCSIYFGININMDKKFDDFFAAGNEITVYRGGKGYELNKNEFMVKFNNIAKSAKYKNTIDKITLGNGPVLDCGNESITFKGHNFNMNGKWYHCNVNIGKALQEYVNTILPAVPSEDQEQNA